jgi:hypothetical protein
MSQVSVIAYLVAGTFLSLCYWDFYFTMLVAVAATHEHVKQALGQTERKWHRAAMAPARMVATRQ